MNPFLLPGPQFLLFYFLFAGAVIWASVFWRKRAELSGAPRIDLSDPYLIAYLRAGESEVLRVATISLVDRGLLVATGSQLCLAENASVDSVRRPLEKALLKKYSRAGEVSWMFEDDGLRTACREYGNTLTRAGLLPDGSVNFQRLMRMMVACLLLGGVGFTKVLYALLTGHTNVGFLIVLMIISIITSAALAFPRLTESGKAVLEDVKNLYSGLRSRASLLAPGGAGIEPLMLAAAFGVGALSAPGFSFADSLFSDRKKKSQGSCGGDSGCGSSSCGSSCGGGCGGGCGGCGG